MTEYPGSGGNHLSDGRRKRALYWVGFLDGAKTSRRIRSRDLAGIGEEADAFIRFFRDRQAKDLLQAMTRPHLDEEKDPLDQVNDVVIAMRGELHAEGELSAADRVDEFLGFCAGIIGDGKVLESEALAIKRRFELDQELALNSRVAKIYRVVADALMDGRLDDDETRDIREWIARLAGDGYAGAGVAAPVAAPHLPTMVTDQSAIAFTGRIFVVAGALGIAPGYEIAAMIGARGGEMADSVSEDTDFVIVADDVLRNWTATEISAAIDAARQLADRGVGLKFVSERGFTAALQSVNS